MFVFSSRFWKVKLLLMYTKIYIIHNHVTLQHIITIYCQALIIYYFNVSEVKLLCCRVTQLCILYMLWHLGIANITFYWCVGLRVETAHICTKGLWRTSSLLFKGLRALLSVGKTAVTWSWALASIRCQVKNACSIYPLTPVYLYDLLTASYLTF